jgi:hypothetical protein
MCQPGLELAETRMVFSLEAARVRACARHKTIVSKYRNVSKYQHSVFVVIVVRPISSVFLASRLIVTLSSQTTAPLYETTEEHQGCQK